MAIFGYNTIPSNPQDTGTLFGTKFTTPAAGTITSITFYVRNTAGTGTWGAAVYSDAAGSPNAKLAEDSGNVSVPVNVSAWYTVPLSLAFAAGIDLWLMLWSSGANGPRLFWDVGAVNQTAYATVPAWETYPDPWAGGTGFLAWKLGIYATYNPPAAAPAGSGKSFIGEIQLLGSDAILDASTGVV